jgi:hypothetical protein
MEKLQMARLLVTIDIPETADTRNVELQYAAIALKNVISTFASPAEIANQTVAIPGVPARLDPVTASMINYDLGSFTYETTTER